VVLSLPELDFWGFAVIFISGGMAGLGSLCLLITQWIVELSR
jgi:hypothetical protein